jgi:oligoendopeptidase F
MFKQEGAGFLPKYEAFLRLAGSDSAENVVKRTVGRNIDAPEFWSEAIQSLQEPLDRLQNLLPRVLTQEASPKT